MIGERDHIVVIPGLSSKASVTKLYVVEPASFITTGLLIHIPLLAPLLRSLIVISTSQDSSLDLPRLVVPEAKDNRKDPTPTGISLFHDSNHKEVCKGIMKDTSGSEWNVKLVLSLGSCPSSKPIGSFVNVDHHA